jgi:hypothetical protein
MDLGELLRSSSVANGCVPKFCPVRLLYSFDAASNIAVRLAAEGSAVGLLADIWDSAMAVGGDVELGHRLFNHPKTQPWTT